MTNFNDYLNIINKDKEEIIKTVVKTEMNSIVNNNYSYEGICKLIANNIKGDLKKQNIKSCVVDLNEFGVDHVSLIAEYYFKDLKRVLIDPSIVQFKINIDSYLNNKDILLDLEEKGYVLIDQDKFSRYISMFAGRNIEVDLDQYVENALNIKEER